MLPLASGLVGRVGYSSAGIWRRAKRELPQVTWTLAPSVVTSTGLPGRLREMSASRRPRTSTVPGSETSAATVIRAETS